MRPGLYGWPGACHCPRTGHRPGAGHCRRPLPEIRSLATRWPGANHCPGADRCL